MKRSIFVIGAGLYGSVVAHELAKAGYKVDIFDKRDHVGGNVYDEKAFGIIVQKYGPHIFHTSNKSTWDYINQFGKFARYVNTPMSIGADGELYNLPFNMNTFVKLYNVKTPKEVMSKINEDRKKYSNPSNLEEKAISLVGKKVYNILIKKYTEKQWGRKATELPASIIDRLPVRYTFNNDYYRDDYQGIPINGYTSIIEKMLNHKNINIHLDTTLEPDTILKSKNPIFYSGSIDELLGYRFGKLDYRSLRFETAVLSENNFQGVGVVNNAGNEKYTRTIEHKWLGGFTADNGKTVVTREYPCKWQEGRERYYPINIEGNNEKYQEYQEVIHNLYRNIVVGGRLGKYKYLDMSTTIECALNDVCEFIQRYSNDYDTKEVQK
jgi:UDP-galactopyranose mutase